MGRAVAAAAIGGLFASRLIWARLSFSLCVARASCRSARLADIPSRGLKEAGLMRLIDPSFANRLAALFVPVQSRD